MIYLKQGSFLQGGKYRIVRFMNSGGFGCTYEAEHVMFRKRVAIKEFFVKDFCVRDESTAYVTIETTNKRELVNKLKRKFIDEARSLFDLHHAGIVRVTDVFEENDTAYYVMDYINGRSLKEVVDKEGSLPESRALNYIRQVADALEYVHSHNLLHLDIKPGNIMVDDNDHAVLIDFGTSRQYVEVGNENTSTLIPYTNGYAPPEQVGSELVKLTPATDLYALGSTLYCLLSGVAPVSSNLRNSGESLRSLPASTSSSTRKAVKKAMKLNRFDRLQNVDAFRKALKGERTGFKTMVWLLSLALILVVVLGIFGLSQKIDDGGALLTDSLTHVDTIFAAPPVAETSVQPVKTDVKVVDSVPSTTSFYVSTSPNGATIYLDGKKMGKSPLEGMEVSRGKHIVKLVLDGYESFSKKYTFGDKPVIINESLVPVRTLVQEESSKPSLSKISSTSCMINGHAYVDLGLSVKWATMNVGANSTGDYGDYFAWGEVHPKSVYTKENSKTYGKYMGNISGNSQYDAARYHWGSSWRLPTASELKELIDKCRWSWTEQDGHKGCLVVGPNGNSIFLPAAGYYSETLIRYVGRVCDYWSVSHKEGYTQHAFSLWSPNDGDRRVGWDLRYSGKSVRPVSD